MFWCLCRLEGEILLEDSIFARPCHSLIDSGSFSTICDSTNAAIDLWKVASVDISSYLEKVAQRHRLKKLGLDDVIGYCFAIDQTTEIPVLEGGKLVRLS